PSPAEEAGVKILVTGSTGFLGTVLVERLLAHGETDIRCFLRSDSRTEGLDALEKRYPGAKLERFVGSLNSRENADRALFDVDVVYHLAAALAGAPADIFLNTVVTSKNVLEALASQSKKPRVVLVSSFGVYGVAELPPGSVLDESTGLES